MAEQQASIQLRSDHSGCNQVGEILDLNGSPFPAKGELPMGAVELLLIGKWGAVLWERVRAD